VTDGVMMCKPLVLSSGEWVLPASTWRETDKSARMIVSTDHGKTWSLRRNVPKDARALTSTCSSAQDGSPGCSCARRWHREASPRTRQDWQGSRPHRLITFLHSASPQAICSS
jgi:hypothetical protein